MSLSCAADFESDTFFTQCGNVSACQMAFIFCLFLVLENYVVAYASTGYAAQKANVSC